MQASRLTDDLIDELSGRLTSDWYKLGIELDLDIKVINHINDRSRVHAERWPLRMLQGWREMKHRSHREQMVELVQALDKIHRNDLVAVVRENMEEAREEEISDRLLMQLAEGVNMEWYNLGIQLNVPTDKMDVIKMEVAPDQRLEPGVAMLRAFRDNYTGGDIIRDLKKALREIRRLDMARYIDENLSPTQQSPHHSPVPGSARHAPPSHQRSKLSQVPRSPRRAQQQSHRNPQPTPVPSSPGHAPLQGLSVGDDKSSWRSPTSDVSPLYPSQQSPHHSPVPGSARHAPPPSHQRSNLSHVPRSPTWAQQQSHQNPQPAPETSSPRHAPLQAHSVGDDKASWRPSNPQSSLNHGFVSPTSDVSPSSTGPPYYGSQSGSSSIVTSGASYPAKK